MKINWRQCSKIKQSFLVYLFVLLCIIVFIVGFLIGRKQMNQPLDFGQILNKNNGEAYLHEDVDFDLFWQLWNKLQENYVDQPVAETKLFYSALAGMVAGLEDPYSMFLDPQMSQEFTEELSGKFEGIGAEIGIKKSQLMIVAPLPDTPAERAGLRPRDQILAIDNLDTRGMPLDKAVQLIRGEKGTPVVLTIMRDNFEQPQEFEIIREVIKIITVKAEMKGDVGYIKMSSFNDKTEKEFVTALDNILKNNPKALILDLRNNPGGYLNVSVEVASHWIESGQVVVKEKFSDDDIFEYKSTAKLPRLNDYPTIVLANEGSASASEIVAGALQDYALATILGEQTFGKGSVQAIESLADGSAVKLTVARWLTPQGNCIEENGIIPDEEVELTIDDYNNDADPQLDRALEILNNN
ncbi:MAG: S41 family peptidase [Patescibacteria group bacterium]|nr:S41 family peptidase [Patescibacteria group bacterium]